MLLRAAFGCTPALWLEQVSEGAKDRAEWVEPVVAVELEEEGGAAYM